VSVQKRVRGKRVRWEVRWLEDGQHRSRTFDRRTDAVDFEADQRRRLQLGAHAPAEPSRERLGSWLRRWWDRDASRWAASTRLQRGPVIDRWIIPRLEGVRLRDLGSARVRDWQAAIRSDGCTPHIANQALRILSAALGAAARDGLLPQNPCRDVRKLPHVPARPRALTPLEVERIRLEMPTLRDIALLGLLCYAGLRPEEALALRWCDVGVRVLTIDRAFSCGELKPTKTHQRRTVEILEPLASDIAALRPRVVDPETLVAPSETGAFLNLNNWRNRVWTPATRRAGVRAAPYDGRHTFASLLINEGRSPLLVSAALGHSTGELVWRRYAHLLDERRAMPNVSVVDAIKAARDELQRAELRPTCDGAVVRHLRAVPRSHKK
jgi:integrase